MLDLSCGRSLSNASKLQFSLGEWVGEVTRSCDHGSGQLRGAVKLVVLVFGRSWWCWCLVVLLSVVLVVCCGCVVVVVVVVGGVVVVVLCCVVCRCSGVGILCLCVYACVCSSVLRLWLTGTALEGVGCAKCRRELHFRRQVLQIAFEVGL